ncbi:nucleotide disphospho-sugar-binding domain-containing protein [Streptomyces sp. NPDC001404]|uniref:nucleotide disphospho-sugar-binding domain-containing protein n=1 Tax=Streptomyces sp. NPDC001404 TaxID=3364571 RepID=UPI0036C0C2DA
MRVLVVTWAWPSHYMPLVPTLWALRAEGHEVCVASQPALARTVTDSGMVFAAAGEDLDHAELHRRRLRGLDHTGVPEAPPPGAGAERFSPAEREKVSRVFGIFADRADAMVDDVIALGRSWRPDVILYEPTSYAGPLAAAVLGIPAVRHLHGVDLTYQVHGLMPELLAPTARRLGLPGVNVLGDLTVDPCPPSMQVPADVDRVRIRHVPYNGPAVLPDWLRPPRPPGSRRRICVTFGRTTTALKGDQRFLPPVVVEAARALDAEIVVALDPKDREALGDVPDGVRVVESLALHLLLPTCAAVVHQGGIGTTLAAVAAGVPQLVLPQLPDQIFTAERVAATGAGLMLRPAGTDDLVPAIARALSALVEGDIHRDAAARLHDEMQAQPAPLSAVPALERLTRIRSTS